MIKYKKIGCVADDSERAKIAFKQFALHYDLIDIDQLLGSKNDQPVSPDVLPKIDAILALGGDGFMLHTLHRFIELDIPIFGMNCGTIGFLLNHYNEDDLLERMSKAKTTIVHPLSMKAIKTNGSEHSALAINEVSLLRETNQAAHIRLSIDNTIQIEQMIADGILISTPAGSSAYNSSVGGPIIPLESNILAITPISPFRPKRWYGALVPNKAIFHLDILTPKKRPVSAVADFIEIRDVKRIEVKEERRIKIKLLFDPDHSLEERILKEQFIL